MILIATARDSTNCINYEPGRERKSTILPILALTSGQEIENEVFTVEIYGRYFLQHVWKKAVIAGYISKII